MIHETIGIHGIPRGLEIKVTNAGNVQIQLNVRIPYTNECGTPVFGTNHTFAWFVFDTKELESC